MTVLADNALLVLPRLAAWVLSGGGSAQPVERDLCDLRWGERADSGHMRVQHGGGNVSGPGDGVVFELAPDERIRRPLRPLLVTVFFAVKLRLRVLRCGSWPASDRALTSVRVVRA